jgi:radical SAM superfamily enzyme YgiQ (UPF0313 family)
MQNTRSGFFTPVEANSLFLKVTQGCSYNQCAFCATYRETPFKMRGFEEIEAEVGKITQKDRESVRRIFLGDGDALVAEAEVLEKVLALASDAFPNLQQVSIYATPHALLEKPEKALASVQQAGLDNIYMGIETGSDEILETLNKGVTAEEIAAASRKAIDAGITLSAIVMLGAGGRYTWREHARSTGKLISEIDPHTVILVTLVLLQGTPLFEQAQRGDFTPPTPIESMLELKELISSIHVTKTAFKSSHDYNYLKVAGVLPEDKDKMLHQIERALNNPTEELFNPEYFKGF